jgi:hypothetical protein
MISSFEEALGLLRKWESESVPLAALMYSDGVALRLGGTISKLTPDTLVVSRHSPTAATIAELTIGLARVTNFEYRDVREAPFPAKEQLEGKVRSMLVFDLPSGKCYLYETET